jgi:regulator of protease activity HflC (stomatin/prohibitin superfamily)
VDVDSFHHPPGTAKIVGPLAKVSVPFVIITIVLTLSGLFLGLACVISALHRIKEGHVGIYYKYGALMEQLTPPGVHWMQPFVSEVVRLRITPETKVLDPMVCTTRDGVRNVFRDVQVHLILNKTEKSFSNLAASQFFFSRSNKSTTTLQF